MDQYITFISNHPILSMIWIALVVMIIGSTVSSLTSKVKQVSPQQLTLLMNKEDGVVLDIRPEKDFRQSHILGANQLSAEKVSTNDFSALEKYKDKPIIVVCAAGLTASKTANALVKAGFEAVFVLSGGMGAWLNANLPVAKK